jgi:predicted helicase
MNNFDINKYLNSATKYFKDENSSEMSYRTDFQQLLKNIFPEDKKYVIQHDQRTIDGNKPDFIISKNNVPILYIEVKKVGEDLDKIEKSQQASGYTNLIISDYVNFRFYRNGQKYDEEISLGKIDSKNREIATKTENYERLVRTITDFANSKKEPIKSGKHLAKIMGGKAQRIRDNVVAFINAEDANNTELKKIMGFIRETLIADIDTEKFADMYAQTLVYGLFAARYNDDSLENFSRQEARELIPATNPFLQKFFDHIAGAQFPQRLDTIVTELCDVFTYADIQRLLTDYYTKNTDKELKDPIIHFYEDFLFEYNPAKKMEMGVFYTPLPVVRFIIRGVDQILKKEFGIVKGLADNTKITKEKIEINAKGKEEKVKEEYHKVQILDVATGTGTFLNEVAEYIHGTFKGREGVWESYAQNDLIPRLHGFELMMASYTIAHLKLGMTLENTGIKNIKNRLSIYLTNTLEDAIQTSMQGSLFGFLDSISEESRQASKIKRDYPIMCVIGNPPYSGISQNKNYTANNAYKVEIGGKEKLKEKKNWLDDDYVKFIRFAESLIEKNGEGIVGMITAHGYIDNPTFRGMRWHLRDTFDSIYVLDLHGNSNKKEASLDGSKDENVFDIKTGVSIIFGVKKSREGKGKKLATVYQYDLYGFREEKTDTLDANDIFTMDWNKLPEDVDVWRVEGAGKSEYQKGFSVAELFPKNTTGIVTMGDSFIIDENKDVLAKRVDDFLQNNISESELKNKYGLGKNYAKWVIDNKSKIQNDHSKIVPLAYRPFDIRYTYFDKNLVWRTRGSVMESLIKDNVGFVFARSQRNPDFNAVFICDSIIETKCGEASTQSAVAPLYLYSEDGEKTPNLNKEIWDKINGVMGDTTPENILDYVYAVLHSPGYRERYKEFLKSDFPRVPYPKYKAEFRELIKLGEKLRGLHLTTDAIVNQPITTFSVSGSSLVDKIVYKDNSVYINSTQYFGSVPKIAWEFYIGGYQPAQKYLKDRKGRVLTNTEIEQYERIIVVLVETDKIMKEIDAIFS